MRAIHLCSEFPPQPVFGLGRYVHELLRALAALGYSVDVITNSHGRLEPESTVDGVRVRRVHFPPPPRATATSAMLLHFNLQLVERCIEERLKSELPRIDVINAHDWLTVPAAFHLGRLLNAPVVTTLHDIIFNKARNRAFAPEDEYVAGIENWACHTSAAIVVLSEAVKHEVVAYYHADPARIHVVPGGTAVVPLVEAELSEVGAWREKLAPGDETLFLYAGRLDPEKGVMTLLNAARRLREHGPHDWKLVVAGTGQLKDQVEELIERSGLLSHVALLGYLPFDQLRMAYAAADVCVVPSDYEPFGLVALEAQRLGTPVIVSNTGGLAETLRVTQGGLSFTPGSAENLANCMFRMLESRLRVECGQRGQQNVSANFNWETIARKIHAIQESSVATPPPQNLTPPPWTPPTPAKAPDAPASVSTRRHAPISDLTLFWDTAFMPEAGPLIEQLSNAHALKALGGTVNLVPVTCSGRNGSDWHRPKATERVRIIESDHSDQLCDALKNSAAVIADARLASPLLKSGLAAPRRMPTLWAGAVEASVGGQSVKTLGELYVFATKLLCDERLRRVMAPDLAHSIPQIEWKPPDRSSPEVLHVLPQLVTGGAETTLLELVKAAGAKYGHHILCLGPLEGPLPDEFRQAGVEITQLPGGDEGAVLQFLKTRAPDLIHLHSMSYIPSWMPAHRRLCAQRIAETEHVVNIGAGHFGPVNVVACVSEATKKTHVQFDSVWRRSGTSFTVIYNGIDPADFESLPAKQQAREMLDLPLDRPIIGRVSALARNKLPAEALESIQHVVRAMPNALFVIVGDGPQRKPAEEWVASHGLRDSVLFLGERRDIPKVLRAFDVFAYYTTKDALGNVILEAIAAGIPVVTTDVEGTREALGEAPGELVKLGAFEEFAAAVRRWAAPDRVQKPHKLPAKFTRRAMAEAYSSLYASMKSLGKSTASATRIAPKKGAPEVSILMPVFNTPKEWVLDALASIKAQHYPLWKLKLVDDGSDTEYHQWLGQTIKSDRGLADRTKILRLASNKGVAAALNAGLHACKTELVARMDADDRMHPDRLALQVAAFNDRPQLTVLGGWACLIDEKGSPTNGRYSYPCGHRQLIQMLGKSCAFAHPTVMYRRDAILAAGGYSAKCRHYEDYDLWVRLAKRRVQFANLPVPLIDYRVHDKSVSQVHRDQQSRGAADCAERARKLVPASGRGRPARVIFTGVHHSYGIPGRGLSVEQFFFARAMEHMPEIELHRLPADDLIRQHGQKKAGEMLRAFALEKQADLVFTVLGNPELDFLRDDIKALTDSGILTLNWNCDDQWRFPYTSEWASQYSHMVTTDPLAMERFEQLGLKKKIILSQWGCNPFDYSPGGIKDIDVSFIGQPYGNRPAMIDALRNAGIHVILHGAGWNDGQEIEFSQMIDVLRRSRVVLNFSRATQGDHRQIKARFFEIPACGSFMLTEPADGMDAYLAPGRNYDTFDSADELVSKARLWLKRPERDAWALEASAIIRSVHSFAWRLQNVFEAIGLYNRP